MNLRFHARSVLGVGLALVGWAVGAVPATAQLEPPSGPIAKTMKRLDQLEPRKLLRDLPGAGNAVVVVSQAGRYYLDGDIQCPSGKHAIVVAAPGDVTIELNGFSLVGAPGSLDGVHAQGGGGGAGKSFVLDGSRSTDDGVVKSFIWGFTRGVAVGDVSGDGYPDIAVSGLTIRDCGQGMLHLHAQHVVHRDIAVRNMLSGDAVHIEFDAPPQFASGPRQTTSLDSSRVKVDGCAGHGVCVVCPPSGHLEFTGESCSISGAGGDGACVLQSAGGGGGSGRFRYHEWTWHDCGGAALHVDGGNHRDGWNVVCVDAHMSSCHGGFRGADLGECELRNVAAADVDGDGVAIGSSGGGHGAGKVVVHDISITRCTGKGLSFTDCDDVSGVHVAAGDVNGDGFSSTSSAGGGSGGGGAGKVVVHDISIMRCHANGFVTTGRADVSCVRVSMGDIDGDGVSVAGARVSKIDSFTIKQSVKPFHFVDCFLVECSQVAATDFSGPATSTRVGRTKWANIVLKQGFSHGAEFTDCDDTDCNDVRVSQCSGDGIRFGWTQVGGPFKLMAHEATHVAQCGGAGVRCTMPAGASSMSCRLDSCSFSSCTAEGMAVTCPSPTSSFSMQSGKVKFFNDAKGFGLVANPQSDVSCTFVTNDFTNAGGDGLSVVSSDPALSLRGGGYVRCQGCTFSSNGGSGVVCENPLYAGDSSFTQNALYGADCRAPDPLTLACEMTNCVLQKNGSTSGRVSRGRYAVIDCQITDGGSHGLECGMGCLLVTNSQVHRCAGDGLRVSGTLTIQGGALRRNGFAGARCSDGSCVATGCSVELNGALAPAGASPECGLVFLNCSSVSLTRCSLTSNSGEGAFSSSTTGLTKWSSLDCVVQGNTRDGLHLSNCDGGDVSRCTISSNGGIGIFCDTTFTRGRISGCTCNGNTGRGIEVNGSGNLVVSNSATFSGPVVAIFVAAGNSAGEIISSPTDIMTRCNTNDNLVH